MHKKREQAENMGPFNLLIAALRNESLPFHQHLQHLSDEEISDHLAKLDQQALAQLLIPCVQVVLGKKAVSVNELVKVLRDQSLPFHNVVKPFSDDEIVELLGQLDPKQMAQLIVYLMQFFESKLKQRKIDYTPLYAYSILKQLPEMDKTIMDSLIIQANEKQNFNILPHYLGKKSLYEIYKSKNDYTINPWNDKSYLKNALSTSSTHSFISIIHQLPKEKLEDLTKLVIKDYGKNLFDILNITPHPLIDKHKLFPHPKSNAQSVVPRAAAAVDGLVPVRLAAGPRQKVSETYVLEALIKSIIRGTLFQVEIDVKLNEVILIDPREPHRPVNLSALLHSAHLSHVHFNDADIDDYVKFLDQDYPDHLNPVKQLLHSRAPLPSHFQRLHPGLLYALTIYTNCYRLNELPNALFKASELQSFKNLILFMVTSLAFANHAVHELTSIASHENVTATQHGTPLFRHDRFEWREYFEGPMIFESDGLTSTTHTQNSTVTTALYHPPAFAPSLRPISFFPSEDEVLIESDAQMVYLGKHDSLVLARFVNTPSQRTVSYIVGLGIRFAFKHRLSLPYNPDGNTLATNNENRFNHGLEHCIRKVFYVEHLIKYLSRFSGNRKFKHYCDELSRSDVDFIKLIMVFDQIGRESEIGFRHNPSLYREYRQKSAMWFGKFADSIQLSAELKVRGMRLVENLCNPDFVQSVNTPDQPYYCLEDNYLFQIATMNHELDLPRCFNRQDFDAAMAKGHEALQMMRSREQAAEFEQLLTYACECIATTGGSIMFDFPTKQLSKAAQSRARDRFSNNPLGCEKALEQVPTPQFKKALQPYAHRPQNRASDADQLQQFLDQIAP